MLINQNREIRIGPHIANNGRGITLHRPPDHPTPRWQPQSPNIDRAETGLADQFAGGVIQQEQTGGLGTDQCGHLRQAALQGLIDVARRCKLAAHLRQQVKLTLIRPRRPSRRRKRAGVGRNEFGWFEVWMSHPGIMRPGRAAQKVS